MNAPKQFTEEVLFVVSDVGLDAADRAPPGEHLGEQTIGQERALTMTPTKTQKEGGSSESKADEQSKYRVATDVEGAPSMHETEDTASAKTQPKCDVDEKTLVWIPVETRPYIITFMRTPDGHLVPLRIQDWLKILVFTFMVWLAGWGNPSVASEISGQLSEDAAPYGSRNEEFLPPRMRVKDDRDYLPPRLRARAVDVA
ncbi:hypothetical protein HDZ31DRAFT_71798 [Schizophyllum fasciatum]